ncbi:xanthine dehydrogenase subunit XdhB [bacterium YEK0313]|nr:xanthine dehydrogenase subunit XdhB [bacterium YEK0313]
MCPGRTRLPLAGFVDGYRHTQAGRDEIVTALIVPKRRHAVSRFAKLGARKYLVISIAMVAVVLDLDTMDQVTDARIAVGACSAVARRLESLEADLAGAPIRDVARIVAPRHVDILEPIDDIRASAAYRRAAALTLVRDCLSGLAADHARRAA